MKPTLQYKIQIAGTSGSVTIRKGTRLPQQCGGRYGRWWHRGSLWPYDDGDGFSDLIKLLTSDPKDPDSLANKPSNIESNNILSLSEGTELGTYITTFLATDPDNDHNFTYSSRAFSNAFSLTDYNLNLADAEDNESFTFSNSGVSSQW